MRVDNFDCAFECFFRVGINDGGETTRHRVTFNALVAPSGDVACDIFGGKVVAIVPLDTFTHIQSVSFCIVADFPAFDQLTLEGGVIVVLHEVLEPTARKVCNL